MKAICTYSNGNVGIAQELRSFLAGKDEDFIYLEHPLLPRPDSQSIFQLYRKGRLIEGRAWKHSRRSPFLHYARCSRITFLMVRQYKRDLDLFVGHSNIDCVLARLAGCKTLRVIYASIDYMPRRFSNPLLNVIYQLADRMAYSGADAIWHSYPDFKLLKPYASAIKCLYTRHGNNFHRIQRRPFSERQRFAIVYLGGIVPQANLELAIKCLRQLRDSFPGCSLEIIGGGSSQAYVESLRGLARDQRVEKIVHWHGQLTEAGQFEARMTCFGVALCLYESTPNMASWYQLPGKVYAYAACGLPTVVADTIGPVGIREIQEQNIGLVTAPGDLENCLGRLFGDPGLQRALSDNAEKWAGAYDWSDKFETHLIASHRDAE